MASLHPLVAVLAAADRNRKARRHGRISPGRPGTARPGTRTRARRRSPGTQGGRFELPSTGPVGAMRCRGDRGPRRYACQLCRFLLRVAFGERGGLALSRTADSASSRSSSATRASRSARRASRSAKRSFSSGARGVGLEKPAKLSDLSDQLLVGVGSPPQEVMRAGILNNTFRVCSVVDPLSKYVQTRGRQLRFDDRARRATGAERGCRAFDPRQPVASCGTVPTPAQQRIS